MFACRVLAVAVDDAVPDTYAGRHLGWRGGCPGVGGLDRLAEFGLGNGIRKVLIVLIACLLSCCVSLFLLRSVLRMGWDGVWVALLSEDEMGGCFRRIRAMDGMESSTTEWVRWSDNWPSCQRDGGDTEGY